MKLVIHVGQQKTASTTLQNHLRASRKILSRQGVNYSSAFGGNKARKATEAFKDNRHLAALATEVRAFQAELAGAWDTVIVSNENLLLMKEEAIQRFAETCRGFKGEIGVYVYLRKPADHFPSVYQQKVRGFKIETADEYLETVLSKGHYNYFSTLKRWEGAFGAGSIHARLFDRRVLAPTPTEDFLTWIGHPDVTLSTTEAEVTNTSIDPVALNAIRYFSKLHMAAPQTVSEQQAALFRNAMIEHSEGAKPVLTPAQAARLEAVIGHEMRQVAQNYLSPEEAKLLLEPVVGVDRPPPPLADVLRRSAAILGVPPDGALDADVGADEATRYDRFRAVVTGWLAEMDPPFGTDAHVRIEQISKIGRRRKRYA